MTLREIWRRLRHHSARRRRLVYDFVICLIVLSATFQVSLDPSKPHAGWSGAISSALMTADLALNDMAISWFKGPSIPRGDVVVVDTTPHRPDRRVSWPQRRGRYASLLRWLCAAGARVVVFDITFEENKEEHPEEDRDLLRAVHEANGRAVFARGIVPSERGIRWQHLMDGLADALTDSRRGPGYGAALALLDVDTVLRRVQIAWTDAFPDAQTLSVVALGRALGQRIEIRPDTVVMPHATVPLGPGGTLEIRVPDYHAPDPQGEPGRGGNIRPLAFAMDEIVDDHAYPPFWFKNAIVVVVPPQDYDAKLVRSGGGKKVVPGGYVVAGTIETLLNGNDTRRAHDEPVWLASLVLILLMNLMLWHRPSAKSFIFAVVVLSGVWGGVVLFVLWLTNVWIDAVVPWTSMVACGVFITIFEHSRARGVLSHLLSERLVDHVVSLGAEGNPERTCDATVVFVDLRGYTSLVEKGGEGPWLLGFVNQLHEVVGAVFTRKGGTIMDYMGDAQMIVFGVPGPLEDHAMRAIEAVLALPGALMELNARVAASMPGHVGELRLGVGIASGPVTFGLVGTHGHREFAALGDTTNVAARLQSLTREFGVACLLSHSTYVRVEDRVQVRVIEPMLIRGERRSLIRGKSQLQNVYELLMS